MTTMALKKNAKADKEREMMLLMTREKAERQLS